MLEDFQIALILAKDEAFMKAVEDLESLDYQIFQHAMRVVQLRMYSAVAEHSLGCEDCPKTLPTRHCEKHSEMFAAVEGMLTSEDTPEFKGTLPSTTNYTPAPAGYEELVKEMYS